MKSRYLYSIGLVLILLVIFSIGFSAVNKVENFTLTDYSGKKHSLTDYKDSKAVVLMFIATRCPVSNAYNGRMASLYSDYKDKNIAFLAINSNNNEDLDEIKKHARDNSLMFPILKDENNKIADNFDAQVTPEIFVIDQKSNILYHGRIDDEIAVHLGHARGADRSLKWNVRH